MTKILLLGGTGFLGQPLLKKLEQKHSLKIMIHNSKIKTEAEKFKGNILDKMSFSNEIRNDETIINLLGQFTPNESDYIKSNIVGGLNLLNSCIEKKIKQIILISSINVYGESLNIPSKENDPLNPISSYGQIKMITEQIYKHFSKMYGINITVLRLAGIYGTNQDKGFLAQIIKSVKDKTIIPICYNKGEQQRDLLYIDDAIDCIMNAVDCQLSGFNTFNVSSGKRYSMKELISMIGKISKSKISVKYSSEIPDERCIWADNTRAKKLLNFSPEIEIQAGLTNTINQFYD